MASIFHFHRKSQCHFRQKYLVECKIQCRIVVIVCIVMDFVQIFYSKTAISLKHRYMFVHGILIIISCFICV